MSRTIDLDTIGSLSVAERSGVIGEIWDTLETESSVPELTDDFKRELDRRLAAHEANPTDGYTWEEVKAGLRNL